MLRTQTSTIKHCLRTAISVAFK